MPMTLPLLGILLGIAFGLGLAVGAMLTLWWLPYRLARSLDGLNSLAIRTLQVKQRHLERLARRGRHLPPR